MAEQRTELDDLIEAYKNVLVETGQNHELGAEFLEKMKAGVEKLDEQYKNSQIVVDEIEAVKQQVIEPIQEHLDYNKKAGIFNS